MFPPSEIRLGFASLRRLHFFAATTIQFSLLQGFRLPHFFTPLSFAFRFPLSAFLVTLGFRFPVLAFRFHDSRFTVHDSALL